MSSIGNSSSRFDGCRLSSTFLKSSLWYRTLSGTNSAMATWELPDRYTLVALIGVSSTKSLCLARYSFSPLSSVDLTHDVGGHSCTARLNCNLRQTLYLGSSIQRSISIQLKVQRVVSPKGERDGYWLITSKILSDLPDFWFDQSWLVFLPRPKHVSWDWQQGFPPIAPVYGVSIIILPRWSTYDEFDSHPVRYPSIRL